MSFKLLRSPNAQSSQNNSPRLSFDLYYFAAGDSQKDSGLEIEFMLDTGASCSIINYRTYWEDLSIPVTHKPPTEQESNKNLLWTTCTHVRAYNHHSQLRPGWNLLLSSHSLGHRDEVSKLTWNGFLPKSSVWYPHWSSRHITEVTDEHNLLRWSPPEQDVSPCVTDTDDTDTLHNVPRRKECEMLEIFTI